jgi:hypothetical protein
VTPVQPFSLRLFFSFRVGSQGEALSTRQMVLPSITHVHCFSISNVVLVHVVRSLFIFYSLSFFLNTCHQLINFFRNTVQIYIRTIIHPYKHTYTHPTSISTSERLDWFDRDSQSRSPRAARCRRDVVSH